MDGSVAIERNCEALKSIVAMLVGMAGLAAPGRSTLPRHLWLAILSLLRPAEAAARRLIIAAARGLVVPPPPRSSPAKRGIVPSLPRGGVEAQPRHMLSLPLLDPLRRLVHRRPSQGGVPRICVPGFTEPFRVSPPPPPPTPDDPIDVGRLRQRLAALASALDDLPRHALRFARWKARLDAGRFRRVSPLRGGRPPGGRLSRFDPTARRRANIREVDEILAHAHALAVYALERLDTS